MSVGLDLILIVLALVLFGLATFNVGGKFNLIAAGLFCVTLTLLTN